MPRIVPFLLKWKVTLHLYWKAFSHTPIDVHLTYWFFLNCWLFERKPESCKCLLFLVFARVYGFVIHTLEMSLLLNVDGNQCLKYPESMNCMEVKSLGSGLVCVIPHFLSLQLSFLSFCHYIFVEMSNCWLFCGVPCLQESRTPAGSSWW